MIAPGSGLAMLIASLIVSAHPLAKPASAPSRDTRLSIVPGPLDEDARRAWSRAIANDDTAALRLMLEHHPGGALIGTRASNGKTALMAACKAGDLALVRALVDAGADPGETSATGGTPFMFAVLGNHLDVARWLHAQGVPLDARGSNGWSAVTIAAAKGFEGMLGWLLETEAPADVADVYGFTPLMRAVDNAHALVARRLLEANVRVDAADERGNTALHHAVANGDAELVTLLLDHGADPALANRDGLTPTELARGPAARSLGADGIRPDRGGASERVASDGRRAHALPPAVLARLRGAPAASTH